MNFEDVSLEDLDLTAARSKVRRLRAYDAHAVSLESAVHTGSESVVQQHLVDEVDINTIVRRFGITASRPSGDVGGVYGDFTGITDFESAVEAVERAQAGFMALPAEVRERFGNDAGRLLERAQQATAEVLDGELGFAAARAAAAAPVAPVVGALAPAVVGG